MIAAPKAKADNPHQDDR